MKIVQFLASRKWGGLESLFVNLCNELAKTNELSVIILEGSSVESMLNEGIQVYVLESNASRMNPFLYIELYKILRNVNPILIHTHGAKASEITYALKKKLNFLHIATKHNSRKGKIFNKLDNVIAVSKGVRESILSDDVKVIYNGINPIELLPQNSNKIFTLLAVGRLDKIKGFDILIEECAKLNFRFILQIVGEGEEEKKLKTLIHKLNLEEKVILQGFRKNIPQLMKNADVVVMSSHSEGFSLVMVESLFYANLFISTHVSGATEILDERFLIDGFNIANKLTDIYRNCEEYKKAYSSLCKKIKGQFLLKNIAKEHIDYYEQVLKGSI